MPIIPNAARKLRADKRRAGVNARVREEMRQAVAKARKKTTPKQLAEVYSKLDRAVKAKLIHRNKAARLKSRLSGRR